MVLGPFLSTYLVAVIVLPSSSFAILFVSLGSNKLSERTPLVV